MLNFILGLLFLPFVLVFYLFKYIIKFYKSEKISTLTKVIVTIIFIFIAIENEKYEKANATTTAMVNNIEIYQGETKQLDIKLTPEKNTINNIDALEFDWNIASINSSGEITGKKPGTMNVILEVTDNFNEKLETNEFIVTVIQTNKPDKPEMPQKPESKEEEFTRSDAKDYKYKSIEIIDDILKTPKTAEYPSSLFDSLKDWDITKTNNIITVKSYVDAQNIYGTIVRSKFTIQYQLDKNNNETVTYIEFDGEVIKGTYQ